jgi:hypothetical protein
VIARKQKIRSGSFDVGSLLTLGTLHYFIGDLLALLEGLETIHIDRGKMREQIFAAIIGSDKTKPPCFVEPFDYACCHVTIPLFKETPCLKNFETLRAIHDTETLIALGLAFPDLAREMLSMPSLEFGFHRFHDDILVMA